jgi:hypothetical protein
MRVVLKLSLQFVACTNGVVNSSGDIASALPDSEDDVVSDMASNEKTIIELQMLAEKYAAWRHD